MASLATVQSEAASQLVVNLNPGRELPSSNLALSKDATSHAPSLRFPDAEPGATYLAVCVDLDAPFPALPLLSPLLHWIQPGLTANGQGVLHSDEPSIVEWLQPMPPPFGGPHRYVLYLYKLSDSARITEIRQKLKQDLSIWARSRWSPENIAQKAGLGVIVATGGFRA